MFFHFLLVIGIFVSHVKESPYFYQLFIIVCAYGKEVSFPSKNRSNQLREGTCLFGRLPLKMLFLDYTVHVLSSRSRGNSFRFISIYSDSDKKISMI